MQRNVGALSLLAVLACASDVVVRDDDGSSDTGGGCSTINCEDGNPCTDDLFYDEQCSCAHPIASNGRGCRVGGASGVCEAGECIASDCDPERPDLTCDDENPCTTGSCDRFGNCHHEPLDGVLVPDEPQRVGDCLSYVCSNGSATQIADDNDLPAEDGNLCTFEVCMGGSAYHPPVPDGTPCGSGICSMGVCR